MNSSEYDIFSITKTVFIAHMTVVFGAFTRDASCFNCFCRLCVTPRCFSKGRAQSPYHDKTSLAFINASVPFGCASSNVSYLVR